MGPGNDRNWFPGQLTSFYLSLIALQAFEQKLTKGTKFCCGNVISLADLCLIPQVYNANRFKVDMEQFPKIVAIMNNLNEETKLSPAHPDQQPDAMK